MSTPRPGDSVSASPPAASGGSGASAPVAGQAMRFAVVGTLSTGLHLSGWKGLPAVERNPASFSTLKPNLVDQPM